MSKGFIKIRRGLEEHQIDGRLGFFEIGVYLTIHFQANFETGQWVGSAPRLVATTPRSCDLRSVKRALQQLEDLSYIKRFMVRGKRGNYRVLIHKYEPQSGALRGKRLNAILSTDWSHPVYEPCPDGVSETVPDAVPERVPDVTPVLEVEVERELKTLAPRRFNSKAEATRREVLIGKGPDAFAGMTPEQREAGWQRAFGNKVAK